MRISTTADDEALPMQSLKMDTNKMKDLSY